MTDATFIDEGTAPGIRKFPTPWDGTRGPNDAEGYYTPLASRGAYVYLAENTWAANVLSGHVAQLTKDGYTLVDSQDTGTQSWVPGSGVAVAGHASASVGVEGGGRVLTRRGGHAEALDARYEATPGTLASISNLAAPSGADVRADYRRFWRAPDGTLWLYTRGNDGKGELYRWDEGTEALVRTGAPFSDYGAGTGSYAANLTFDPVTGDIYAVTEALLTATSGFPGNFIGCVRSTDNGASWEQLDGTPITLPLDLVNQTVVAGGTTADEVVAAQITLDANGNPFIIFGWENDAEGDTFLATWTARWNGAGWDFVRLYAAIGDGTDPLGQWQNSKIIPQITTIDGTMIIVMKEVGVGVTQRLVALIQYPADPPTTWRRWVLHPDDLYTGAYIDQWSLPDDGFLRIYPVTSGDLVDYDQTSEIWELPIEGVGSWGDATVFDPIAATEYTDTPVDPDECYRYRVAARDIETGLVSAFSDWLVVEPIPEIQAAVTLEISTAPSVEPPREVAASVGLELTVAPTLQTPPVAVPETAAAIPFVLDVVAELQAPPIDVPEMSAGVGVELSVAATLETPAAPGAVAASVPLELTVTAELEAPPTFTEDLTAFPLMMLLAQCLCEEIESSGLQPTCFCGIVPGQEAVFDYCSSCGEACGSAWVRLVNEYPTVQFPAQADGVSSPALCGAASAVVLEVGIVRCAPLPKEVNKRIVLPTFQEQFNAAMQQAADKAAARRAIECCVGRAPDGTKRDYVLGTYSALSSGDCVGGAWQVTIRSSGKVGEWLAVE